MSQQLPMKATDSTRAVIIGGRKPVGARTHWLEFGTSHSAPYPFLRPTVDSTAQVFVNKFVQDLGPKIDKEVANMNKGGRR